MKVVILIFIIVITACSSEKKDKKIDYHPIKKTANKHATPKDTIYEYLSSDFTSFNQKGILLNVLNADTIAEQHFLDRFSEPKNRSKFLLTMEKDTYIYGQWGFPDSLHRKRAMYNWLDRYGEKQISINWLDNKRINPKNLLILFNANSIIEVQSKGKIELNKWMQFQKINFPKDSLRYVIEQPAGRKCTWYVAIKNKLIPCSQREVSTDPM